jgi:hypothetical protein
VNKEIRLSIALELLGRLFLVLLFEFILYLTGSVIIRLITFGVSKAPILSFREFKTQTQTVKNKYSVAVLVGIAFYIAIIVTIIALK